MTGVMVGIRTMTLLTSVWVLSPVFGPCSETSNYIFSTPATCSMNCVHLNGERPKWYSHLQLIYTDLSRLSSNYQHCNWELSLLLSFPFFPIWFVSIHLAYLLVPFIGVASEWLVADEESSESFCSKICQANCGTFCFMTATFFLLYD